MPTDAPITSTDEVLAHILRASPPLPADLAPTLRAWWSATANTRQVFELPIDRALVAGAHADRLGFAFAVGYAEALRALVPGSDGISALCATEEDGNHPRAIRTLLARVPERAGHFTLTGHKKWATVAAHAPSLLVVARTEPPAASDAPGLAPPRPTLVVVRVPVTAANLRITASTAPFVPEIEHAEVHLDHVPVTASQILPGDGYTDYLKPFRTIEDLHVHAALLGYFVALARRRGLAPALVESLLALAVTARALAVATTTRSPSVHLAVAGFLDLATRTIRDLDAAWAAVFDSAGDPERQRWLRDRPLLDVAGTARLARRDAARAATSAVPGASALDGTTARPR